MSEAVTEVLLFDDGQGTRYAIPTSELGAFRLPEDAELDDGDVEGFMITTQHIPHSSAARVRNPMVFDKSKGWAWQTTIPVPRGSAGGRPR